MPDEEGWTTLISQRGQHREMPTQRHHYIMMFDAGNFNTLCGDYTHRNSSLGPMRPIQLIPDDDGSILPGDKCRRCKEVLGKSK